MHDLIIISISIIASMTTNVVLTKYLLKNNKVGTDEYKKALKYPKIASKRQEDIVNRLSELEREMQNIPFRENIPSIPKKELEALRNDVSELQRCLREINLPERKDEAEQEILNTLNIFATRVAKLEAAQSNTRPNNDYSGLLLQMEERHKKEIQALQEQIEKLSESKAVKPDDIPAQTPPYMIPEPSPKVPPEALPKTVPLFQSRRIIEPDQDYIRKLYQLASTIEGNLPSISYEMGKFTFGIRNILNTGDFDDPEEIMTLVHELIEKYIYGSDTKVSVDEWHIIEKFLSDAGYELLNVSVGDNIIPFKTYFERPIPVTGGIPNTIKHIQLSPYVLSYADSGETETLFLCGKCTYYK